VADGERNIPATPEKRRKAREEGRVAKSQDLSSAISLLISVLVVALSFKLFALYHMNFSERLILDFAPNPDTLGSALRLALIQVLLLLSLPFSVMVLTVLAANLLQVGFLFAPRVLSPNFSKLNPINGFQRIFSTRGAVELGKSLVKLGIVGTIAIWEIIRDLPVLTTLTQIPFAGAISLAGKLALSFSIKIAVLLLVVGAVDYWYQKYDYEKGLMMSLQELKEEFKRREGNPEVKRKLREKSREILKKAIMKRLLPTSDVVVTNPTHYAVGLKYDEEKNEAPIITAKGTGKVAEWIISEAKKYRIEIVRNPPLARELYQQGEIGEEVPPHLFKMVAAVFAYLYSKRKR
jgi:flagellar biosynthetic protein FlhB